MNKRSDKVVFSNFKVSRKLRHKTLPKGGNLSVLRLTPPLIDRNLIDTMIWVFFLAYAYCEGMEKTLQWGQMHWPHF